MEEWKEYKLGEITVMKNGKKRPQVEGRYPVYGGNGIMDYSNDFNSEKVIIVGRVGAYCGCVYKCDEKCWVSDNAIAVLPKDIVDYHFLFYLMSNLDFHHHHIGGAQPLMTQDIIGDFNINLPSLKVQQKIASILKSLDDKIEVNRRINENLEQQAQALFNEVLMDTKLPRNRFLKDYAFVNPTRSIKKGEIARYIDMSSLPTKGSFPSDWVDKPYNGGMKFQNGDTLMARITPCLENGKTAYINFLNKDEIAFGSTEYIVMAPHDGIPSEMFYFLARNEDFVSYAVAHMNGSSGRQRVSASDIENYIMPDIPPHQIEQFGMKAKAIMEKIKTNSLESRSLATLRDTLLPKLMSGELKVNEVA